MHRQSCRRAPQRSHLHPESSQGSTFQKCALRTQEHPHKALPDSPRPALPRSRAASSPTVPIPSSPETRMDSPGAVLP